MPRETEPAPIARDVLTDKVYERVRIAILSNRIPQGGRINLGALAREFQTSNTPLRHALARLESEGLVISSAYKGFEVAPPLDAKSVEDLYAVRLLLEPESARAAAAQGATDGIARLDEAFAAFEETARGASGYSADLSRFDLIFHEAVANCSGNAQVAPILSRIMVSMRVFDDRVESAAVEATVAEHEAVRAAIRAGHTDAAYVAMQQHLNASRERWRLSFRH
jgi:DNA-binding GntR family transcriptional regulator